MNDVEITQPQIINIICPRCKLTWMNKSGNERFYFCYACSFILFDKQIQKVKENSFLTWEHLTGIINKNTMKQRICNFFDNPWVAFPMMFLSIILFMYLGLHYGR
jgi:hypothetical protein